LDGCWLEDSINTMVMQSVKLGVPAVQLEMPWTMRNTMTFDNVLLKKIANIIGTLYKGKITEYWNRNQLWSTIKSKVELAQGISVFNAQSLDIGMVIECCKTLECNLKEKMI